MGNQEWTIQRNRQHWAHKTQEGDEQSTKPKTKKFIGRCVKKVGIGRELMSL